MATRHPVAIEVYAGTFDAQPLAFAYLYDAARQTGQDIDLEFVEVICKADPEPRLRHFFEEAQVSRITDALGLRTTVILIFPEALPAPFEASEALDHLGSFTGSRLRA